MISSISDADFEKCKEVLDRFTVHDVHRASALESGIFCILNQASRWERPSQIIYSMRQACYPGDTQYHSKYCSLDFLLDKDKVNDAIGKKFRFHHDRRLDPFIDYFGKLEGSWWEDIRDADVTLRTKYTNDKSPDKVKWIKPKTFSLWHLCLGGHNLLPIDIHLRRNLYDLGLTISNDYIRHRKRLRKDLVSKRLASSKDQFLFDIPKKDQVKLIATPKDYQMVVAEPTDKEYLVLEQDVWCLFARDPRFVYQGRVHSGLVASALWWAGANRGKNTQACLFDDSQGDTWKLPYGQMSSS